MSTSLLVQATRRQRLTDSVYVALPRPKWTRTWQGVQHVLRRLELGLILVTFGEGEPEVEIVFHPLPLQRQKQQRKRRAVLQEIAARSGDFNQGGSTRRKLMTAYRENAIQIACVLERLGPRSAKELRAFGTCGKTYSILRRNVYGWFERVAPGQYALRMTGREELAHYPEVTARQRAWAANLVAVPVQESAPPARTHAKRTSTKREKV